jgi:MFS transporter, PPP family, 3-phenylpropionic acid transporter
VPDNSPAFLHLNRTRWSIRLYFFMLTGGAAFLMPFMTLFYNQNGLSGTQIGAIATVTSLAALLAAPLWGRWSDQSSRPRVVIQAALLLGTLVVLWLGQQRTFFTIAALAGVYSLINAGVEPLSNRLALRAIQVTGDSGFGSVRLWGSFGWAVLVLASGWMIEATGSLYTAFVGAAVLQVVSVLVLRLVHTEPQEQAPGEAQAQPGLRALIGELGQNRVLVGLAAALTLQWFVLGGLYQFQPIYLQQLGAGEALIGFSWMISAAVELPGMWWTDRLIRRFGAGWILAAAMFLQGVRTIPVLLWPSVPAVIGAEVITGLAYSFLWVGMVVFINDIASGKQATTVMALYTVTLPSLVLMIAGPITGLAFDHLGAYWLYAIALVGSLLAGLVLALTIRGGKGYDKS